LTLDRAGSAVLNHPKRGEIPMTANLPSHGLQLRSTLAPDGTLRLTVAQAPVAQPGPGQVVVRMEAAPINPSDLMTLLAAADPASARVEGNAVLLRIAADDARLRAGRFGQALNAGLEGAGTVIAAGKGAEEFEGRAVALLSLTAGTFGQYVTIDATECAALPDGVSTREGAALFCNPLTALAIAETVRLEGGHALIHTAAASNLGQMLVKICREDGLALVNVVRRQEQADLLKSLGAEHVCNSSAPGFDEELRAAIAATGATMAFDAIGGGDSVAMLHRAMEDVAVSRLGFYSPYGSMEPKQVLIYGHLDRSPIALNGDEYGMDWTVRQWAMPQTMARVGPERADELRQRILDGLKTTFASHFSREISLAEALDPTILQAYARQGTGEKYLINPML
jgi:NADPH:quinone reductase-like Zn-dependent oxidoreductase